MWARSIASAVSDTIAAPLGAASGAADREPAPLIAAGGDGVCRIHRYVTVDPSTSPAANTAPKAIVFMAVLRQRAVTRFAPRRRAAAWWCTPARNPGSGAVPG